MTAPHNVSAQGTGVWRFKSPPAPTAPGVPFSRTSITRTAVSTFLPPEYIPLPPSQALVLAGHQAHVQPPDVAWAPVSNNQQTQSSNHPYHRGHDDVPLRSIVNQPYSDMPFAAEDVSYKKASNHHSHQSLSSAHVTSHARYASPPQIIYPPPPPEPQYAQPHSSQSASSTQNLPLWAPTRTGSPFLVYHVCKVCRNPRSKSYHQRHPVRHGDDVPDPQTCQTCEAALAKSSASTRPASETKPSQQHHDRIVITRTLGKDNNTVPVPQRSRSEAIARAQSESSRDGAKSHAAGESGASASTSEQAKHSHSRPSRHYTKVTTNVYIDTREAATTNARETDQTPPSPDPQPQQAFYRHVERSHRDISDGDKVQSIRSQNDSVPHAMPQSLAYRHVEVPRSISPPPTDTVELLMTPASPRAEMAASKAASLRPLPAEPPIPKPITRSEVFAISRDTVKSYRQAERAMEAHPEAYSHVRSGERDAKPEANPDAGREYRHSSYKAKAIPAPVPAQPSSRASTSHEPEMEHVVVERDHLEAWPDMTREEHYRARYDEPVEQRSLFTTTASTVEPWSSISQRPPSQQRPVSSYRAHQSPERDHSTAFYNIHEDLKHASQDVLVGQTLSFRPPASGAGMTHASASVAVDKEDENNVAASHRSRGSHDPLPRDVAMDGGTYWYSRTRREVVESPSERPQTVSSRIPSRYGPPPSEREYRSVHARQAYAQEDIPASRSRPFLVAVDERPVGDDVYVRETYDAGSISSHGSDKTRFHTQDRNAPPLEPRPIQAPAIMDSVAIQKQRMSTPRGHDHIDQYRHTSADSRFLDPQQRPYPPHDEDVIRDDKRYYREITGTGERIVSERLVRSRHRGESSAEHQDGTTRKVASSPSGDPRVDLDPYASSERRGILRSPSDVPLERGTYPSASAHVKFASYDNIVPSQSEAIGQDYVEGMSRRRPRHRSRNLDGLSSSRAESDRYFDERERGRTSHRFNSQVEGIHDYHPAKAQVLTRALSESPSRERAEDIKKKAARKSVRVEVPSTSHGPFRAEVSPTPSMEVMTTGSQVGYEPEVWKELSSDSDWLEVVRSRQYIDAEGIPFEDVRRKVVHRKER